MNLRDPISLNDPIILAALITLIVLGVIAIVCSLIYLSRDAKRRELARRIAWYDANVKAFLASQRAEAVIDAWKRRFGHQ